MPIDSHGIYIYDEADIVAPTASDWLNRLADSTSTEVGALQDRASALETHTADTGWITTDIAWASGWSRAAAPVAGWQRFAYRVLDGRQVTLNGVITAAGAGSAVASVMTLPAGIRPTTNARQSADWDIDVLTTGVVRIRSGSWAAAAAIAINVAYLLG